MSTKEKKKLDGHKTKEFSEKMRMINLGRKLSEEHKLKISIAKLGVAFSKKHCRNISVSLTGRKFSDEHRRNLSVAWHNSKNRFSRGSLGKHWKLSSETKRKMSIAQKLRFSKKSVERANWMSGEQYI